MNYQWYPGHMTKAKRMMEENIKLIDLVIELVDSRIPESSRNPDIDTLARGKARMILLNKSDLSNEGCNAIWEEYYKNKGITVVKINSRDRSSVKAVNNAVAIACKEKIERDRKRGIINRPVKAMVVGIPNVGKSTFINALAGKACAKTGDKPGVTKGKQWIKLNKGVELLDTPGILWPKFENKEVGKKLAFIGSINDAILDPEELACELIDSLRNVAPGKIAERYEISEEGKAYEVLAEVARARRCLLKGEELDTKKAAMILLDDYRSGKIGRITLELPEKEVQEEQDK